MQCDMCKLYFTDSDKIEIDHIIPRSLGGSSDWSNLRLMHSHCHDIRHSKVMKPTLLSKKKDT